MHSVSVKDLSLSFGSVEVLQKLDIDINDGEFLVLLGSSGCGKSTLLNCIAGLLDITDGQIFIKGRNVTWDEPSQRGIGMVFQSYALYPQMSVEGNLSFGLKNAKMPAAEIAKRVARAAEILQIGPLLKRKPAALSGGQRQRVAIGRAIVRQPSAFLFDEPLSNLDASLRVNMRLEISELHKSLDTTMIYVTHDQVEAMTMADRIAVFNGGIIEQVGTPLELYQKPVNRFVAGFIGSPKMNFIDVMPKAGDDTHAIGVRPEHLKITQERGLWSGKVGVVEHLGSETFLHVHVEDAGTLTVKADGDCPVSYGDVVNLTAAESKIMHFDKDGVTIPSLSWGEERVA